MLAYLPRGMEERSKSPKRPETAEFLDGQIDAYTRQIGELRAKLAQLIEARRQMPVAPKLAAGRKPIRLYRENTFARRASREPESRLSRRCWSGACWRERQAEKNSLNSKSLRTCAEPDLERENRCHHGLRSSRKESDCWSGRKGSFRE